MSQHKVRGNRWLDAASAWSSVADCIQAFSQRAWKYQVFFPSPLMWLHCCSAWDDGEIWVRMPCEKRKKEGQEPLEPSKQGKSWPMTGHSCHAGPKRKARQVRSLVKMQESGEVTGLWFWKKINDASWIERQWVGRKKSYVETIYASSCGGSDWPHWFHLTNAWAPPVTKAAILRTPSWE